MEESKTDKYEYLNAPCLLEKFKQTYLTSLNVFLNDEKFQNKISTLPLLKSSAITKYEKILEKEAAEKAKKGIIMPKKSNNALQRNPLLKKAVSKGLTVRYIVIDHELVEITLAAIEESNECNSKLTDPFNSYFHENNEKIRKKALEQIVANIIPKNDKNKKNDSMLDKKIAEQAGNSILYHDLEVLESKYKKFEIENKKKKENFKGYFKSFQDSCETHNILSLDQKIDYFVFFKKNNLGGLPNLKQKGKNNSNINNYSNKKNNRQVTTNDNHTNTYNSTIQGGKSESYSKLQKTAFNDIGYKYTNELKSKYKINEDFYQMDIYEQELDTKIKSFQFLKKNFEQSAKFIDKLRMYLRCEEISPDRITLRECDMNGDRFYYLISKKYFDFSVIRHLNLSKNNLGDIGGCYLLSLIESYGIRFDYLNISYNKLGKQSIEILVNILQSNNVVISSICIGGNQLGDKLFSDLCIGISKNSFLNKLFTNSNDLGKISSVILGTILKYDRKLKLLDVSQNNFGDENIGYMLKGLICNTSLEVLMINDMGLTNKSLRVFETTLCINTTLRELFLERNKLNYKGWRVLSDILNKNKYIEYVSLVGNKFESEHFDMISEQQRQVKIRVISKTDYFFQITASKDNINFYEYFY